MGDDRLAAVYFRDRPEVDGESELDDRAFRESEVPGLDENAVGREIVGLAQGAATPRDHDVYRGPRPMPAVKAALHVP
jgi:hypothetical protein